MGVGAVVRSLTRRGKAVGVSGTVVRVERATAGTRSIDTLALVSIADPSERKGERVWIDTRKVVSHDV